MKKFKSIIGFTLIELIIVITIVSILAFIVVLVINPNNIFINSRNTTRVNDLSTYQLVFGKYFCRNTDIINSVHA